MSIDKVRDLAEAHWEYIAGILEVHGGTENDISIIRYHYITAFIHGWKHAKEDNDD